MDSLYLALILRLKKAWPWRYLWQYILIASIWEFCKNRIASNVLFNEQVFCRKECAMLACIKHEGLNITITPGFTWDEETSLFKGEVLYGDEILTICITRDRMRRSINAAFEANSNIEILFRPETWIAAAEHPHDREVYLEEDEEPGPENV